MWSDMKIRLPVGVNATTGTYATSYSKIQSVLGRGNKVPSNLTTYEHVIDITNL